MVGCDVRLAVPPKVTKAVVAPLGGGIGMTDRAADVLDVEEVVKDDGEVVDNAVRVGE